MKIATLICMAIAASALAGRFATADNRNHTINKRQQTQQERVRKGVQSGELTRKEVRGTHDRAVNARQGNQTHRIVQGVASGELTRKEAGELVEEHRDIKQLERDGFTDWRLPDIMEAL